MLLRGRGRRCRRLMEGGGNAVAAEYGELRFRKRRIPCLDRRSPSVGEHEQQRRKRCQQKNAAGGDGKGDERHAYLNGPGAYDADGERFDRGFRTGVQEEACVGCEQEKGRFQKSRSSHGYPLRGIPSGRRRDKQGEADGLQHAERCKNRLVAMQGSAPGRNGSTGDEEAGKQERDLDDDASQRGFVADMPERAVAHGFRRRNAQGEPR